MLKVLFRSERFMMFGIAAWTFASQTAHSFTVDRDVLANGFTSIALVSPSNIKDRMIAKSDKRAAIDQLCGDIAVYFRQYGWEEEPCGDVDWQVEMKSKSGHPLIYASFGDGEEATLVLGGVHPDELTPVPIAFRFARHLQKHPSLYEKQGIRVVVAPLVNPDGFLRNKASRTNANGVDLNRNFFTMDWYEKAKDVWIKRRDRTLRHFPGYFPNSEIETMFQIGLVDRYTPDKILSIHAPLGFLDYDGPGDRQPRSLSPTEDRAKRLVQAISEKSRNYRVVDYSFYPGSLGNYAGNERRIPTVTLELETTDPKLVDQYWEQFLPGMLQSIHYPFQKDTRDHGNATEFSDQYPRESIDDTSSEG